VRRRIALRGKRAVAFLDFIKNRQTSKQQSVGNRPQEQKPGTAKEMYARQAAGEKANPMEQMPPAELAKLDALRQSLKRPHGIAIRRWSLPLPRRPMAWKIARRCART
jgi:hypothetical protein